MKTLVRCTLATVFALGMFATSASAANFGNDYGMSYGLQNTQQTVKQSYKKGKSRAFKGQGQLFKQNNNYQSNYQYNDAYQGNIGKQSNLGKNKVQFKQNYSQNFGGYGSSYGY